MVEIVNMLNMFLSSLSAKYGNTCNGIQSSMFKQSSTTHKLSSYKVLKINEKFCCFTALRIIIHLLRGGWRAYFYTELWTIKQVFNCCFITVSQTVAVTEDKETQMSRSSLRSASKRRSRRSLCPLSVSTARWTWKGKATNLSHSIVRCCRSQPWNFVFLVLLHKGFSCGVVGIRAN